MSDVHGNVVALDAVIAAGVRHGVDRWWVLGDLAAIGPQPLETLERLAGLPGVELVQGNTDRYAVTGDRPGPTLADVAADPDLQELFDAVEASFSWTTEQLAGTGWLEWLADLPLEIRTTLPDGTELLGVHVLPGFDDGPGITPHRPEHELQEAFDGCGADVVAGGHTHQPTDRQIGSVRAINLGSVSNPITDDLRASFVIIDATADGYRVEHHRVSYDHGRFLSIVERSDHPERDYIASFQRGNQFQHPALRTGAPREITSG